MKFRYIVIEDDTNVWENIRNRMREYPQWNPLEFSSELTDAIAKIREYQPQLIFSDWSIRGGNAYQILNYISTIQNYNPYIIFFTGYQSENPEIPQRIINDFPMVNKYIIKPIYENLTNHLKTYVQEAEAKILENTKEVSQNIEVESTFLETVLGKIRIFPCECVAILQKEDSRHKTLYLSDGNSYELKQTWEELFEFLDNFKIDYFVAHNRKSVINKLFIKNIEKPYLYLENNLSVKVSREQWKKLYL